MKVLRISHSAVVSDWRQRERELERLGAELTLASARSWDEGGARVHLEAGTDRFVVGVPTLGRHPALFVYDPRPLWRLLAAEPDLVDLHEEPFSLAAAELLVLRWLRRLGRSRRAPMPFVVYSAQNLDKRYPAPFSQIERLVLRSCAGAHVCNEGAGERLRRRGLRGTLLVLPLGVDLRRFHPEERRPPSEPLLVGYVGRLAAHKGVGLLLEAVAPLPGWQLELVGEGPEHEALVKQAAALSLDGRVRFTGHLDGDGLARRYRSFDVLAVPSLTTPRWVEQFGRVVVEAMASGVPVVASDSGALPEVIGEAGILVPEGDPTALCRALEELSRSPERWEELRAAGLERARQFDWTAVAKGQLGLYEHVLAAGAAA